MAAAEQPERPNLSEQMVLRAFEHRESVGKVVLSAKDITSIINSQELEDHHSGFTPQAVNSHLKEMRERDDPPVVPEPHGDRILYRLPNELKIFGIPLGELQQLKNAISDGGAFAAPHMTEHRNPLSVIAIIGALSIVLAFSAALTVYLALTSGYTILYFFVGSVMVVSFLAIFGLTIYARANWGGSSLTPRGAFRDFRDTTSREVFGTLLRRLQAAPDMLTNEPEKEEENQ